MLIASLPPEAVRSTATWTMIVALVLLVFVMGVALVFALRRGRRLRDRAEHHRAQTDPIDQLDPWVESGRRMTDHNEDLLR